MATESSGSTTPDTRPVAVSLVVLEPVKTNFEAKLAASGVPLELTRTQVVEMALKNELARQDAEADADEAA